MENKIEIFKNDQFGEIRTITEDGNTLFCDSDVAKALGYARPNEAVACHCKGTLKRRTPTKGGEQETLFITEGNVYRLIVRSKLPTAEKFERWVFDEVIPTIRKHGMYSTDYLLENPDIAIAALQKLKEEREERKKLESTVAVQIQQISELQPKASYYDLVLNCKDLIAISKIAKDYGKSAIWMNEKLAELKVQYRQGDVWLLYQKYAEKGYTSTKTHTHLGHDGLPHAKVLTMWTQKGRLFIYELLKANGILPLIEQKGEIYA